jgi:hypothetical protein
MMLHDGSLCAGIRLSGLHCYKIEFEEHYHKVDALNLRTPLDGETQMPFDPQPLS